MPIQNFLRNTLDQQVWDEDRLKQMSEARTKSLQKLADKFGMATQAPASPTPATKTNSVSKLVRKGIGKALHSMKRQNSVEKQKPEEKKE